MCHWLSRCPTNFKNVRNALSRHYSTTCLRTFALAKRIRAWIDSRYLDSFLKLFRRFRNDRCQSFRVADRKRKNNVRVYRFKKKKKKKKKNSEKRKAFGESEKRLGKRPRTASIVPFRLHLNRNQNIARPKNHFCRSADNARPGKCNQIDVRR